MEVGCTKAILLLYKYPMPHVRYSLPRRTSGGALYLLAGPGFVKRPPPRTSHPSRRVVAGATRGQAKSQTFPRPPIRLPSMQGAVVSLKSKTESNRPLHMCILPGFPQLTNSRPKVGSSLSFELFSSPRHWGTLCFHWDGTGRSRSNKLMGAVGT